MRMKKKPLLSTLMVICSITSVYASSQGDTGLRLYNDHLISESVIPITTYTYDLDPLIVISKNVNEKGAVVMSGQLGKEGKFTDKQTDISSLLIGTYLIRINNSETIVKINKQ
jgi:hypothetical protein